MPTINRIGKETINDRLIFEVTDTDPSTVFVSLALGYLSYPVGGTSSGVIFSPPAAEFLNDPEIGTTDTFRFEVNKATRNFTEILFGNSESTLKRYPELLSYDFVTNSNTMISYPYAGVRIQELDVDKNIISTTNFIEDERANVYPLNLYRNESLSSYEMTDTGDSSKEFMTDAPIIQDIKRGDFVWVSVFKTSFEIVFPYVAKQEIVFQELDASNSVTSTTTRLIQPELSDNGVRNHPTCFQFEMSTDTNVVSFQVFVRDIAAPNTERSLTRRWNARDYCDEIKLWWLNRFNAMELTYFEGNRATRIDNSRRTVETAEPINATFEQGGTHGFNNEIRRSWKCSIKRNTPEFIKYITGILYSKRTVIEENGELTEVICTDSNVNEFEKDESIQFLTFDFIESKTTEIW